MHDEITTITHGDTTIDVRQQDNGEYRCPRCDDRTSLAHLSALRRHLSTAHNIRCRETRVCRYCDEEFRIAQSRDIEYCSIECSNKADNRCGQSELCRFCGTFLSSDEDGHCGDCTQLAALADGGLSND